MCPSRTGPQRAGMPFGPCHVAETAKVSFRTGLLPLHCTGAQPPSWPGTAQTPVPSKHLPAVAGAHWGHPHQLHFQYPQWHRPQDLSLLLPLLLAAVHRAWLDEYCHHQGSFPLPPPRELPTATCTPWAHAAQLPWLPVLSKGSPVPTHWAFFQLLHLLLQVG